MPSELKVAQLILPPAPSCLHPPELQTSGTSLALRPDCLVNHRKHVRKQSPKPDNQLQIRGLYISQASQFLCCRQWVGDYKPKQLAVAGFSGGLVWQRPVAVLVGLFSSQWTIARARTRSRLPPLSSRASRSSPIAAPRLPQLAKHRPRFGS